MKSALKIKLFILCTFVFAIQFMAHAQIQPSIPNNPSTDPDVPITGIEILIGAGALIGARKIARLRNKK